MLTVASAMAAERAQLTKEHGDRLQRKIDEIAKNGSAPVVLPKKTPVSEDELNSYLTYNVKDKIPHGLANPDVTLLGDGWLAGRVSVDLDEFNRQRRNRSLIDPLTYLSGRVPVRARGYLRTSAGKGRFQLESAEIRGIPLPEPVVQELVRFFSRTPQNPDGFDLDTPFQLPAQIQELVIMRSEVIVVQ